MSQASQVSQEDQEKVKLAVALPLTDDKIHTSFFDSFVLMSKPASYVYMRPAFRSSIAEARNNLVQQAIDNNCTHILMMDTDQTYPSNTIPQLLSHNLPVVTAKVHRRYPPFDHLCMRKEGDKLVLVPDEEIEKYGLVEVDATGTGCVLYNISVFNEIPKPWFQEEIGEDGKPIGEDVGFCYKLQKYGYKVFVDCSLDIGHLANLEVNYSTYKLYQMLKKAQREKE